MKINIISDNNTVFNNFIREIRDIDIQNDSMRFRRNIERIGEVFAYEISKDMEYHSMEIQTPLGISKESLIITKPILATILRAGLPLHQGLLNYFDQADSAFISAYRKDNSDGGFEVEVEYISSPIIDNRTIILCDPMLASGTSMVLAIEALLLIGKPKHIHIVGVIASREGVDYLERNIPILACTLWLGAVDKEMNSHSYIIPGLGDAGDLAFGKKI